MGSERKLFHVYRVYEREGKATQDLVQDVLVQADDELEAFDLVDHGPPCTQREAHHLKGIYVQACGTKQQILMQRYHRWDPSEVAKLAKQAQPLRGSCEHTHDGK